MNSTSVAHNRSGEPDVQQGLSHTRDSDDLYSHLSLASFSFGAPTAHDTDTDSTISVQALSESGAQSSSSAHQGDSGGGSETRRFHAEMPAIGNGRRRHSLPANWLTTVRPSSDYFAGSETGSPARVVIHTSTRSRALHASDLDLASLTVHRPSYNDASVTVTSSNRDQPSSQPADYMFSKYAGLEPTDNLVEPVFQGIDLNYIFNVSSRGGLDTRRSSLSFVASQSLPSDAKRKLKKKETGSGEDFDADDNSFLAKHDWAESNNRTLRRDEWSFVRDRELVSLPSREPNGDPRHWDVWRCSQIGQIRVERATLLSSGANQQRLNVEHDVDPGSTNRVGGPTAVVQRHSEALAFSINRRYSLSNSTAIVSTRTSRPNETTSSTLVIPTHDGILLATKRVLEQFTIAKSTKDLENHGLSPEEGDNRRDTRREPDSLDLSSIKTTASSSPTPKDASPAASLVPFPESPPTSKGKLASHDRAEEYSDNESMIRMARADALAALDKGATGQPRNEQVPALTTKRSRSWFRDFIGPPGGRMLTPLSSLDPLNPPWMTVVPRSMKKEQSRAIQGLRSSFKDVGLVPSTRSKEGAGIGHESKGKNRDVLTQVPDDSLYMLLPLWVHETDPASAAPERSQLTPRVLDQEQNLYLLVYYVPFDRQREDKPAKKRSRFRLRKGERRHATPLLDVRLGFKVIGRLIAHSDLKGSGIRPPVRGLSVTGSLEEAELGIPPASLRDMYPDNFVIGACIDGSGTTIEFFPEGLEKLGLCVPRAHPPVQLHTDPRMETASPMDEGVVFQPLTAIGRAAVEVAWLGCMALTTFYGPQSQGPA
ncbi:hypothetical protein EDB92DRAFT_400794 [Lactarius akahatsu]|uniref:Uncharacterized protein n=1 Tax=Lactarius akahatsu TaxID=416441 RepID=A0AAD4LJV2_9AGAM|nr:hypothetical protein EDB92DRAFT_400794 [Lactarius akahatsu]